MPHPDYTIVRSAVDHNVPILLVPGGYVMLRSHYDLKAGTFKPLRHGCRNNGLFEGELTNEEQALVMRTILTGEVDA